MNDSPRQNPGYRQEGTKMTLQLAGILLLIAVLGAIVITAFIAIFVKIGNAILAWRHNG